MHGGFKADLLPGKGIGSITLGATMQEVIAILQRNPEIFRSLEIKFCAEDIKSMDILIEIPNIGLNIILDSQQQRVRLIELYKPQTFVVDYCGVPCCGPKALPTFPSVYHQLGPTMPGQYKDDEQAYWLVYPGVTFVFPIPRHYAHMFTPGSANGSDGGGAANGGCHLALLLPDGSTPVASRIRVHPTWDSSIQCPPPPLSPTSPYLEPMVLTRAGRIEFPARGCWLDFTSTTQDVVGLLGKPGGTMQKRMDKLRIYGNEGGNERRLHLSLAASNQVEKGNGSGHYLFNYYDLGLDILLDARRHCIRKLILHTNTPAHADFNDYNKCNFLLRLDDAADDHNNNTTTSNTHSSNTSNSNTHSSNTSSNASNSNTVSNTSSLSASPSSSGGGAGTAKAAPAPAPTGRFIGPDTRWDEVLEMLGPPQGDRPLMHTDRMLGHVCGHSLFYGYPGIIFEVTPFGGIATLILYQQLSS